MRQLAEVADYSGMLYWNAIFSWICHNMATALCHCMLFTVGTQVCRSGAYSIMPTPHTLHQGAGLGHPIACPLDGNCDCIAHSVQDIARLL